MTSLASSSTIVPGAKVVVRVVGTVADLPAAWDALDHGASPFLRAGFLRALEESGSIDPAAPAAGAPRRRLQRSGWTSVYLLAEVEGRLVGAVPAFIKSQEDLGAIVVKDSRVTPAGHKAFVANEIVKLKTAIDAAGQFAD